MSEKPKELKLVFAPGCFDTFEGTQEELDELMAEIQASFDSGEMLEKGTAVDLDDLSDEDFEVIMNAVDDTPRQLQ
jgi:hypothetical protein